MTSLLHLRFVCREELPDVLGRPPHLLLVLLSHPDHLLVVAGHLGLHLRPHPRC